MPRYSIGFDFGTTTVRAVVADVRSGAVAGRASADYSHGLLDRTLPAGEPLSPGHALQHPSDWLDAASRASREAIQTSAINPDEVIGLGVAFVSCTLLPCRSDGTPLCLLDPFKDIPSTWPKLPQHRTASAIAAAARVNAVARERAEPWLARCGGTVADNALFPKLLETLRDAPDLAEAADVWTEAGDWVVWQLIDGPFPRCHADNVCRSLSFAGFHAQFSDAGYPSAAFCDALHPRLDDHVRHRFRGVHLPPGNPAGTLAPQAAHLLGLPAGIAVSAAISDTHARVPGCGVASPSTMVMLIGEPSRHLMNSRIEATPPGIAGVVKGGVLPGYYGYQIDQPDVGDALSSAARALGESPQVLATAAAELSPGSGGLFVLDRLAACGALKANEVSGGAILGLAPQTRPQQIYRALIESTAMELRRICDTFRAAGVPVRRFVATGEVPATNPLLMQIYADVLDARIKLPGSDQPAALGAAILGCLAGQSASGHASMSQTIHAMAAQRKDVVYRPDLGARKEYDKLYATYRSLTPGAGALPGGGFRRLLDH